MDIWTFNDLLDADGATNLIWLWFRSLPKSVRFKVSARFEAKLDVMRIRTITVAPWMDQCIDRISWYL